jgi:hypothetical protein
MTVSAIWRPTWRRRVQRLYEKLPETAKGLERFLAASIASGTKALVI